MAQFQKGEGGRPKGVPNKATGSLREFINELVNENREQVKEDFKALEPKDRIAMFEKLLRYSLPTLQSTTLQAEKPLSEGWEW